MAKFIITAKIILILFDAKSDFLKLTVFAIITKTYYIIIVIYSSYLKI